MSSRFTENDIYLFREGTHRKLYTKMGAHKGSVDGTEGIHFAVWAPNAVRVCVMGDFNGWSKTSHALVRTGGAGIWEGFFADAQVGSRYKYHIVSRFRDYRVDKSDPFALTSEESPQTASIVWDLDYSWGDDAWMATRHGRHAGSAPISIYEMHFGSWMAISNGTGRKGSYRQLAPKLVEYLKRMNFTHVEFLPLMEHPFYGSWGYQTTGYFAPTSRYGTPQDLMFLIDQLHQNEIGVILDWVPSHFTSDEHGLGYFDGTHLYEHADPRQRVHPDWNSLIFNYGRNEVRSFLLSNALFWLDKYHVDGLRVDAVASMLYLDYSRKPGQWVPNRFGGREHLQAIDLLREFNEAVYEQHPDVLTVAEESTAWPMVSRPTYVGGLGFGYKWDMGWMHDTLKYLSQDPVHRKYHHDEMTFRMLYAFSENFVLPLSHDEVVHGKGSLLGKMPGDRWQKFASLRVLLAYMYSQVGKKLLFMGGEFGQWREWNHDDVLDWQLLQYPEHAGLQRFVEDLNRAYRYTPALHVFDNDPRGFEWLDPHDSQQSVFSYLRKGYPTDDDVIVVCNFTPIPRENYRVGAPHGGTWQEMLNSDATLYGGSGWGNMGGVEATPVGSHGQPCSLTLTVPPLGAVFLKGQRGS